MRLGKNMVLDLFILLIITVPAFFILLNNQYFSMHDDQQIARLFLLDQGLKQGYLFPRWVDYLGFGFGYPLFNFYPPLVYYLGELFHLASFSFIWSVKLTFIAGFFLSALGIFLLTKKIVGRIAGFLATTLLTYFFYHAVLIYVRGALAEFFSLAVLPFVFLAFHNLYSKPNLKNSLLFGVTLSLLITTQPLIALPTIFFLFFFFIFYFTKSKEKFTLFWHSMIGGITGLSLSAFFWLPSILEKKYTLVDSILIKELANYKLHFICLQQFIYSPWGYGGSAAGCVDGMTFQLGRIHLGLILGAIFLSVAYLIIERKKTLDQLKFFPFFLFLLVFSLFMTTTYSSFIWDNLSFLWYLQFPWRFLTFVALFISITGSYFIYFLIRLLQHFLQPRRLKVRLGGPIATVIIILLTIFVYSKYFKPQRLIETTDNERTSFEEIAWRISSSSYEFVPKGVKTKRTTLNTTSLAINKQDLPARPFEIISGKADVRVIKNKFQEKEFMVNSSTPIEFRLNNYNFPGWKAEIDGKNESINDNNNLKLITVKITKGEHKIKFIFTDTPVRFIANLITVLGTLLTFILLIRKDEAPVLSDQKVLKRP